MARKLKERRFYLGSFADLYVRPSEGREGATVMLVVENPGDTQKRYACLHPAERTRLLRALASVLGYEVRKKERP